MYIDITNGHRYRGGGGLPGLGRNGGGGQLREKETCVKS